MQQKKRQLAGGSAVVASPGEEWLPIGYFSRVHGLKGGLFLKTPDRREEFGPYTRVLVKRGDEAKEYSVERAYVSGNEPVLVLGEVTTREKAQELLRAQVFVHRDETEEDDGEEGYLVADLLGMKVFSEGHGELGEVVGVVDFGAQETLEIRLKDRKSVAYYPFMEDYVLDISLDEGTISVVYLPEFLEEE